MYIWYFVVHTASKSGPKVANAEGMRVRVCVYFVVHTAYKSGPIVARVWRAWVAFLGEKPSAYPSRLGSSPIILLPTSAIMPAVEDMRHFPEEETSPLFDDTNFPRTKGVCVLSSH